MTEIIVANTRGANMNEQEVAVKLTEVEARWLLIGTELAALFAQEGDKPC